MKKLTVTALVYVLTFVSMEATAGTRTINEVRQSTKYPATTSVVNGNYQSIYRKLKNELERCYNHGAFTANQRVDSELYMDIQEAEFGIAMYGAMTRVYMIVDLKGKADETTEVVVKTSYMAWKKHMPEVHDFLETEKLICKQ